MVSVLIRHKVTSFKEWLPAFRDHADARRMFGCQAATVYPPTKDDGDVAVLLRWADPQRFREYMERSGVKERMAEAGVASAPEITIFGDPVQ